MGPEKEKVVREKPIPDEKKKIVEDFKEMIEKNRTVLIASCKNLPGQQFHEIKKKLRGKAEIRFARKTAIERAIDGIEKGALKNLKELLTADFALIFSDMDAFELSGLLTDNESPSKAKSGDKAPKDIEIEPGPTELIAGPAISELQSVGLKVKVTDGKLEIIQGAVVAHEGDEISANVASVLSKLDVTPMKVGFIPLAAYDSEDDKVYNNIIIDKPGVLAELRNLIGKALGFAVSVGFVNEKTIGLFIAKAGAEEKVLSGLLSGKKPESDDQDAGGGNVDEEKKEIVNEGNKPDTGDDGSDNGSEGDGGDNNEKGKQVTRDEGDVVKENKNEVKSEDIKEEVKEVLKKEIEEEIPESPETNTDDKKEEAAVKIAEEVSEEVVEEMISDNKDVKEENA
jgi:large subunit ribosomal protein L10